MVLMTPIFTSHFSIGKSILTLSPPEKQSADGADSIFSIAVENNLKKIFLVEESMTGFFDAFRISKSLGIQLIFGYKFSCVNNYEDLESKHKLIAFAKNDEGCKDLNKIYSFINTRSDNVISNEDLLSQWSDDLFLAVPFYDSFIFNNHMKLTQCIPDIMPLKPTFFIEKNNLPFDGLIADAIKRYVQANPSAKIENVQSIFYKSPEDCQAFQTYKILNYRKFGKQSTLSSPNLDHFGSDEFNWESYKKKTQTA